MRLNDFKLEETKRSGVEFPFALIYKSSIHNVFPGLFTDKNNFFQVKMYSGLFSDLLSSTT